MTERIPLSDAKIWLEDDRLILEVIHPTLLVRYDLTGLDHVILNLDNTTNQECACGKCPGYGGRDDQP